MQHIQSFDQFLAEEVNLNPAHLRHSRLNRGVGVG